MASSDELRSDADVQRELPQGWTIAAERHSGSVIVRYRSPGDAGEYLHSWPAIKAYFTRTCGFTTDEIDRYYAKKFPFSKAGRGW
jgi:hypothetical protein